MPNITLLPAKDYIEDVTREIKKANKRVFVMSLAISNDPLTHGFFAAVKDAAARGIETNIAADNFTFSEFGGYFSPFKRLQARSKAAAQLANNFKKVGATFRWLGGGNKFNPFAGVTHIKWVVVDDTVYSFGGVNLFQEAIQHIDYMLKIINNDLANSLVREHKEIIKADMSPANYNGYYKLFGSDFIYVDRGDRGKSIIYSRACVLANKATQITFVSQYCPSGKLAKILKKKKAKIYFNQPQNARFLTRIFIQFAKIRHGLETLYTKDTYLHAKFMLFEMSDGKKIALSGSHNFSYTGVNFGTREVALETSDPFAYRQLEAFFENNIA